MWTNHPHYLLAPRCESNVIFISLASSRSPLIAYPSLSSSATNFSHYKLQIWPFQSFQNFTFFLSLQKCKTFLPQIEIFPKLSTIAVIYCILLFQSHKRDSSRTLAVILFFVQTQALKPTINNLFGGRSFVKLRRRNKN
jgi:hypothetical protein